MKFSEYNSEKLWVQLIIFFRNIGGDDGWILQFFQ